MSKVHHLNEIELSDFDKIEQRSFDSQRTGVIDFSEVSNLL